MARGAWGLCCLVAGGVLLSCASTDAWTGPLPAECRESAEAESAPVTQVEEDGLPVLNLFISKSLPDAEGYFAARLVYRGQCQRLWVRLRGNTSRFFPKRSFTLEFPKDAPFDEPLLAGGFTGRRKVVLISPFNDNSYMRHRLAFTLWNRMSPDHIQVKAYSAVLYLNGSYHGLYTVADHLDKHLMALQGLDVEGDLFKGWGDDANFSPLDVQGRPKLDLRQGFEKKAGLPESGSEAYDSIRAFTAFVIDSSTERFREERHAWMNAREYEDWWIFSTLVVANDSVSKNAFHYRERGPQGRWRYIPWDLDASFGQDWNTRRNAPEAPPSFTAKNHLFTRMLEDPSIATPMRERYRLLLQGELRAEVVLGLIDQLEREVAAAARRDEARWREEYLGFRRWSTRTDFTTFDEEVEYLRWWVRTRWGALERQLP
ncbi:CotH kinase family protein [Archangium violaceum]|uniref:CotH kinase family protein n=1 Tax=Archangium violaceum TaxID=83451 RepID=UPI00194F022A|nr:CotH kinase family protein [Archangium violaceum]QRN98984.1 CotH kinase family protein [Archangium violaceum]